jgi:sucrose-6F-phosphate phosphohydrolase
MSRKFLLASDMDGTVIPLDQDSGRAAEIRQFHRLCDQHANLLLAYVTGRHLELGLTGVRQFNLPVPDIFVCDVGTSIFRRKDDNWLQDEQYRQQLSEDWDGRNGRDIAGLLDGISLLSPQEDERQKEFKQSYYLSLEVDHRQIVGEVKERLARQRIRANVVYSIDTVRQLGLLDVLPGGAAKDRALDYLRRRFTLNREKIVYAGDSGNDLLAFVSGFQAIVVNNTARAVKDVVRRMVREKNIEDCIYFARHDYVRGVVEGCYHFQLFRE